MYFQHVSGHYEHCIQKTTSLLRPIPGKFHSSICACMYMYNPCGPTNILNSFGALERLPLGVSSLGMCSTVTPVTTAVSFNYNRNWVHREYTWHDVHVYTCACTCISWTCILHLAHLDQGISWCSIHCPAVTRMNTRLYRKGDNDMHGVHVHVCVHVHIYLYQTCTCTWALA